MIDLHTHSRASDGTLPPFELIAKAEAIGLEGIALTDHDTLSGLEEFLDAAASRRLTAVPGVEVACSWYGGSQHIVGLFINHRAEQLESMLHTIRENRTIRNRKILTRIRAAGINLSYEDVLEAAGDHVIGRPHFAAALINRGICQTHQEAFQNFLGRNASAYVTRFLPMPAAVLETIHKAGGLAIWAHPAGGPNPVQPARIRQTARHLARLGLDGIELFYPDHSQAEQETIKQIGNALNLAFSGGSDFHGDNMPGVELGIGRGSLNIPRKYLTLLEKKLST